MAFGKYSYGIYVIHGILEPWLARTFEFKARWGGSIPGLICVCAYYFAATGVTFLLAYAVYHLYEKPFLNLKKYFEYKTAH